MTPQCPDLTTLQVWAGYLSWLGFFKILGAGVLSAGVIALTGGILARIVYQMRVLLEGLGYLVSFALIGSGYWVPPDYLVWTVMIGCILFAAAVFATLWIHKIKGDDPKGLAALFTLVWGAVAIGYNMPEVGFLSMLALMSLLGFSVVVSPLCYAFGFEKKDVIPSATAAAPFIVAAFLVARIAIPHPPAFVQVFMPGAFWAGSFVAYTGMLIMAFRYYQNDQSYIWQQLLIIAATTGGIALGMTFGINPLAGIAGTFLVLYLASKPMEIPKDSMISVGLVLMMTGGIMCGAWWFAMQHLDFAKQYLTTNL